MQDSSEIANSDQLNNEYAIMAAFDYRNTSGTVKIYQAMGTISSIHDFSD